MDVPLDDVGMVQAAEVAKALPTPDRVISSPLLRARTTAEAFGRPVEIDERWIELDYGELDGLPVASVGVDVWRKWRADLGFAPPGGESIEAMAERVNAACEELVAAAADQDIVVVSHVSAVTWVLGVSTETGWRTHLDAASITRVVCASHGPVLRSFNETGHLSYVVGPVRLSG